MKLNPDCIRDILISVEEATDGSSVFRYGKDNVKHEHLKKYEHNEIFYHMQQCKMAGLIVGFQPFDDGDCVLIMDLSPDGHEFLANVRQDSIWNKTKEISAKVGSSSLSTLMQIAINVVTSLINGYFGIT